MSSGFRDMTVGMYHSTTALIFVEAYERAPTNRQDLTLIHEATHKFMVELTECGVVFRSLLSEPGSFNSEHDFVNQYFAATTDIHECIATNVEALFSVLIYPEECYKAKLTDEYIEYYGLLSEFHDYLNAHRHEGSYTLVLQFGLLVLGGACLQFIFTPKDNMQEQLALTGILLRTVAIERFDRAKVSFRKAINKYGHNVELVRSAMIEYFGEEVSQPTTRSLLNVSENTSQHQLKTYFEDISKSYSDQQLEIRELFRRVLYHAARQTCVHFHLRINGEKISYGDFLRLVVDCELNGRGLYIHTYSNPHDFPVEFLTTIPPNHSVIFIGVFDRHIDVQCRTNPYLAIEKYQFSLLVPNDNISRVIDSALNYKGSIIVSDPCEFDFYSNSLYGVKVPDDRTVILNSPTATISSLESWLFQLDKLGVETLMYRVTEGGDERLTDFYALRPRKSKSWIYLSTYFASYHIDCLAGEMILYAPNSVQQVKSEGEYTLELSVEVTIVNFILHYRRSGW